MALRANHPADLFRLPAVTITGATGIVGAPGPAGPRGAGSGTGPTGPQGPQGPVGPAGAQGPYLGTGPAGPTGAPGPQRSDGPTGWWGWGGDWGDDGPTGMTGPTGRTGPAPVSLNPVGVTGGTGPRGIGSYGAMLCPFFADPQTWLVASIFQQSYEAYFGLSNNVIYLTPVFVPFPRTFTQIAVQCVQSNIYNAFRLGIYDCDSQMAPTQCLFDSNSIPQYSDGLLTALCNVNLTNKPYYLAWAGNGYNMYFRYFFSGEMMPVLGQRAYQYYSNPPQWKEYAFAIFYGANYSWTYGPLPDLTGAPQANFGFSGALWEGIR